MLNNPSLDISINGAERAVSDSPVMLSPSATKAAASLMFQTEADLAMAQLDPRNRKGASGEDLLSRNFNWGLSLLNLPGRAGLDVNLGLSLNSLLYTRVGPEVVVDDAAWVEDSLPAGAVPMGEGGDSWTWISPSIGLNPYSGSFYHPSNLVAGYHVHNFYGATQTLQINAGDKLYSYVYLDPANPPGEVMLQWFENGSWEHRAYWGTNALSFGTDGINSRRNMGPLPAAGQWVRLEVSASQVGLEGKTVSGMAFTLWASGVNRAYWDNSGKANSSGDIIWFDDSLPAGAILQANGGDSWKWVGASFGPYSGTAYHQSAAAAGFHQYFFYEATRTLQISNTAPAEKLYTYVYLDPANLPNEIMLQWHENGSWEHRAYWGANNIVFGTNGTASRKYMGPLPATEGWVKLEVLSSEVGLAGKTINGMAFTLDGGMAHWDKAGKATNAGDIVWFDDSLPAGATVGGDSWTWVGATPSPYSGTAYHQSAVASGVHQHYFYGATQTLQVNAGDRLYAYVHLDPINKPSSIMLQWNDGSWDHRAYWGANNFPGAVEGTASLRYMGPLPPEGRWVRLEVPANLVGLEGSTINGMAFTLYGGSASWDKAGKTKVLLNTGSAIHFDLDSGNPAPGFRLGFPIVQRYFFNPQAGKNAYLLIMPSGQAVELREVSQNVFESVDSSYLHLTYNPADNSMNLRPTNGTQLRFEFKGGEYKPTQIKDRNGNYITINYGAGSGGAEISTIVDTLNRVITFNYDSFFHLNSITQSWNGQTHTWATFSYGTQVIQTNFPGLSLQGVANGSSVSVLTQVGLADGSIYKFEYNTYAQVKAIRKYAPEDSNPQSFPADYVERAYTIYNLPANSSAPQSDCPRFTMRTDWAIEHWAGGSWSATDTTYGPAIQNGTEGYVTSPDGTLQREFFATTSWQRGLTTQTEIWSGNARKKWTSLQWTQDNTAISYQLNPRVVETNVYDDAGNRSRSTISYTSFGLPIDVYQYDVNGTTVLQHNHRDYNLNTVYTNRRIIGLPSAQFLYDGNNNLFSKVDYRYDLGGTYQEHQGPPVRHDTTNYGPLFVQGRGNLNSMRRWDVTDPNNGAKVSEYKTGYNTSGSVIFSRDPLNHQTSISYTDSFSDGVNHNTFAYQTKVTDPDNFFSTVKYNFDFGAVTQTEDPKGAVLTRTYDAIGRLERVTNQVNEAYTRYEYTPDQWFVESYTTIKDLATEFYSATRFDGHGRVRAELADHPASVGQYRAKLNHYDEMGRLARPNNWAEIDADWQAAGDDAGGTGQTYQVYDWQGRPTVLTNQDLTTKSISYAGCGCAGGQLVTYTDEMGRRREQEYDILGRVRKERTYHYGGSNGNDVYSTTTYTYNTRSQVTNINVIDNASGVSQNTVMVYDGHGRLKTRQLPKYVGNPQSETPYDIYEYYPNDTLMRSTDPRGGSATYGYNNRHLVTSIIYGAPSGVAQTPNVTFAYDEAGNRTVMDDGPGIVTYTYDTLSRMTSETRVIDDLSRYIYGGSGQSYLNTYSVGYDYNLGGGLKRILTPTGDTIDYSHDISGMVTKVSGTPRDGVTDYIADIKYRAWGAPKQILYGYGGYTITSQYNNRMLISSINDQSVVGANYGYDLDGQLKTVQGLYNRTLDQSRSYDHVGRVTQARSAIAAGLGSPAPQQLIQDYAYDPFNHLTSRSGRYWYINQATFSAAYINDRATNVQDIKHNWQYDVAGDIKRYTAPGGPIFFDETLDWNADGRMVRITKLPHDSQFYSSTDDYQFDGDGNLVSKTSRHRSPDGSIQTGHAAYYVRSTVLSEALFVGSIPWSLENGQYLITRCYCIDTQHLIYSTYRQLYVYAGGELIATRLYDQTSIFSIPGVTFSHRDPYNWIAKSGNASSYNVYSVDPLGGLVKAASQGEIDAWNSGGGSSGSPPPESYYNDNSGGSASPYGYSNPAGSMGLDCYLDGIQTPCEQTIGLISHGSASIDQIATPTGIASTSVPGLSITPDYTDNAKDYWKENDWGIDIYGSIQYKVTISNFFSGSLGSLQQRAPWTQRNKIPTHHEYYMGYLNAKSILSGNNDLARRCREAIGSNKFPDPAELLDTIRNSGNTGYAPDQLIPSGNPNAAAQTTGIGGDAKIMLYARYFSQRDGTTIRVGRQLVDLDRVQMQTAVWLHELSHATGKYTHHASNPHEYVKSDSEVDAIVYLNCIEGAKLPKPRYRY